MKYPFLYLLIALIFSNIILTEINLTLVDKIIITAFMMLIFIVLKKQVRNKNIILISIVIFVFGIFLFDFKIDKIKILNESEAEVYGVVGKVGNSYFIEVKKSNKKEIEDRKLLLNKKIGEKYIERAIKINCEIQNLKNRQNKRQFIYSRYYAGKEITGKIEKIKNIEVNKEYKDKRLKTFVFKKFEKAIENNIDRNQENVIKALVLGDRSEIEEKYIKSFELNGILHIFAISGMHIGILILLVSTITKFLGRKIGDGVTIFLLWSYAYTINMPISIFRACILFTVVFVSKLIYKRSDFINSLFIAAFIIMLINPMSLYDVGFQLSFCACISIALFTEGVKIRILNGKKENKSLLAPSIAAWIGTVPVLLYHFGETSVWGIFLNLFFIPIASICTALSFLVMLIGVFYEKVFIIGDLVSLMSCFLTETSVYCSNLFQLKLNVSTYKLFDLYFYVGIVSMTLINYSKKVIEKITTEKFFVILTMFILTYNLSSKDFNKVELEFLDIGQGDSCLLKVGEKNYLIDTGGSRFKNIGFDILMPYFKRNDIKKLHGVFISHFDFDHCGALLELIEAIKIDRIYMPYIGNNDLYNKIVDEAKKESIEIVYLKKDDKLKFKNKCYIKILNPDYEDLKKNENDNSMAFMLNVDEKKVLFTGDISESVEQNLKEEYNLKAEIIKISHHGSETSTAINFIEEVNPKYSIISVGKNNYGHPSKEVLKRLKKVESNILRTDISGEVLIKFERGNLKVRSIWNRDGIFEFIKIFKYDIISFAFYIVICIKMSKDYIEVLKWEERI